MYKRRKYIFRILKLNERLNTMRLRLNTMRLHSGVFTAARTSSLSIYLSIYLSINMYLSIHLSINSGYMHVKHVFIKALQIKTWRKFELRLSTSVHLLENFNKVFRHFQGLALSKLEFTVEIMVYQNSIRDL